MKNASQQTAERFMLTLLSPLPETDLIDKGWQRDLDRARREQKKRAKDAWWTGMAHVNLAKAERDCRFWSWITVGKKGPNPCGDVEQLRARVRQQMLIAAPTRAALHWKERNRVFAGPEYADPWIAADRARMGG